LLDARAITKIQSIILIVVIVVAGVAGGVAYVFLMDDNQSEDTIKIGFCGDLDMFVGEGSWKAALLAAEHINAEGGILGKKIEIIAEDSDYETSEDMNVASQAFTRLITLHKVDFIISADGSLSPMTYQEISSQHKIIYFSITGNLDTYTQKVLDDYDNYKYYFRPFPNNTTSYVISMADSLDALREYSGFNKIGFLPVDSTSMKGLTEALKNILEQNYAFEVSYIDYYPPDTIDFASFYSAAEAAGVEILVPLTIWMDGIPLAKEWYDRQSPMITWGLNGIVSTYEGWEAVEGKCEDMSLNGPTVTAGYPLTSQTLPLRDSYLDKYGDVPHGAASATYDTIRFILSDAIKRAGSIDTDLVIEALEETEVVTSMAKNFVFTPSHDVMFGENPNNPDDDYLLLLMFQWQDGEMVPVYPKSIMEEAGASYTFPDWSGPWDNIN